MNESAVQETSGSEFKSHYKWHERIFPCCCETSNQI